MLGIILYKGLYIVADGFNVTGNINICSAIKTFKKLFDSD